MMAQSLRTEKWVSPLLLAGGGLLLLAAAVARRLSANAREIALLNPMARARFRELVRRIEQELGWTVVITSGYRTPSDQEILRAQGQTSTKAMRSSHNFGMGIDIVCYRDGRKLGKASSKRAWLESGIPQLAKGMGFRWGGDFTREPDRVHFDWQWGPRVVKRWQDSAKAQFGEDWMKHGNRVKM